MTPRRRKSATVGIKIRMKEPLRSSIERAAKERGVSMNAEMVRRLEESFLCGDVADRVVTKIGALLSEASEPPRRAARKIKACEECGAEFAFGPGTGRRSTARFCATRCRNLWHQQQRDGAKP